MKLIVLGATGGTGLEIIRQAIDHGHSVTAFVRSAERLKQFAKRIRIRIGNLLTVTELAPVIEGHDAVLSGFGPRLPVAKAERHLLQQFGETLTMAMARARVKRVIVESVAFLFRDSIIPPAYLLGRLLFPGIVADAAAMENLFQQSELEWTIARPPELTDKPYTGKYRVREGHLPRFGFKISRADVADFAIKSAENGAFLGEVVGIAN
jgi:putative NADH-flavin reductase